MSEQRTLLDQAASLLVRAAALPLRLLDDDESARVLVATEKTGRLLDGLRATTAADVDDRSRYSLGAAGLCHRFGYTKGSHVIEYLTHISAAEASRRITLGKSIMPRTALSGEILPPLQPLLAVAVTEGVIGVEAAGHLNRLAKRVSGRASGVSRPRDETADGGDDNEDTLEEVMGLLIDQAADLSSDLIAVQAREWAVSLDTDGTKPREEALRQRQAFYLGREENGMTPFHGQLDPLNAGMLKAIFTEAEQGIDRFLTEEDRRTGLQTATNDDGSTVTVTNDPRTPPQRNIDVLMGTVKAGLRASAAENGGMRPTASVSLIVQLADVVADAASEHRGDGSSVPGDPNNGPRMNSGSGVGWIDGVDDPISTATIRRLLCDGEYQQILLGNAGEILYLGKTHRLFSPAQRRALLVRDGGCIWPNCTVPARQCDAHHVIEDSKGGPTHISNGVLLCEAHHQNLHASDFQLAMFSGKPYLRAPFWLDPTGTWKPLGRARGGIIAAAALAAAYAALESTPAPSPESLPDEILLRKPPTTPGRKKPAKQPDTPCLPGVPDAPGVPLKPDTTALTRRTGRTSSSDHSLPSTIVTERRRASIPRLAGSTGTDLVQPAPVSKVRQTFALPQGYRAGVSAARTASHNPNTSRTIAPRTIASQNGATRVPAPQGGRMPDAPQRQRNSQALPGSGSEVRLVCRLHQSLLLQTVSSQT
jgi:hypothetical protein